MRARDAKCAMPKSRSYRHPLSACMIRQFTYPNEAEIIGQVTAVAMRLVTTAEGQPPDAPPRLPKRA